MRVICWQKNKKYIIHPQFSFYFKCPDKLPLSLVFWYLKSVSRYLICLPSLSAAVIVHQMEKKRDNFDHFKSTARPRIWSGPSTDTNSPLLHIITSKKGWGKQSENIPHAELSVFPLTGFCREAATNILLAKWSAGDVLSETFGLGKTLLRDIK